MSRVPDLLLLDGGLGTTLESPPHNITFTSQTPLWSSHLLLTSPHTLLAAQKSFVAHGADVLLTATYQASVDGFAATPKFAAESTRSGDVASLADGPGDEARHQRAEAATLMRSAVHIAREAFATTARPGSGRGHVALSLGAYGATMHPSAEYSGVYFPAHMAGAEELGAWHRARLELYLEDTATWWEVDMVAFETLPLVAEVLAVRKAMTGVEKRRWWISCVFGNPMQGRNFLPDGSSVETVVRAMLRAEEGWGERPWGIGVNCIKVTKLGELVREFELAVGKVIREFAISEWPWLVIYPDGTKGEVYNTATQWWEADTGKAAPEIEEKLAWDEELMRVVQETRGRACWNGILVGGCCKSTSKDIGKLRVRIDEMLKDGG